MTITWTPTDVPAVSDEHLRVPMQILVEQGRGLALFNGLTAYDRDRLEREFWLTFDGSAADGEAVLIRLYELIRVFSCQRLKDMLLENGYPLIWQAIAVAAAMRLNAEWGFNPQKFLWALRQKNRALSVNRGASGAAASLFAA